MNLKQLSKAPTLIKYTIDKSEIVAQYGESLEFYTWDRQPIEVFLRLTQLGTDGNTAEIVKIAADLILDENGKSIMSDGAMLPVDVLMAAIGMVTERLGK